MRKPALFLMFGILMFGGMLLGWGFSISDNVIFHKQTGIGSFPAKESSFIFENNKYRAEITSLGLRYAPKNGDIVLDDWSFAFCLTQIKSADGIWPALGGHPLIENDHSAAFTRAQGITERYLATADGVEQLFVLEHPLGAGDINLTGQIQTDLDAKDGPNGGFHFLLGNLEVLRYGAAVAIDAAGSTTKVDLSLVGDQLSLTVPGEWLAAAVYPVTVDPFIGGDILISVAYGLQINPAIAYNAFMDEWLVVWEDDRDGDADIYAQSVDSDGNLVRFPWIVWESDDELHNPAVAYDGENHRYLIVWQNDTDRSIEGRLLNGSSYASSLIEMLPGIVLFNPRENPDVVYNSVSNEFLVVWQEEVAANNNDLYAVKVSTAGVVDVGGPYTVRQNAADDVNPALIANPTASGDYLLVWSSNVSGNYNILGRRLQSDGSTYPLVFLIAGNAGNESYPALALNSATGQTLVVWEDDTSSVEDITGGGPIAILGRLVESNGGCGTGACGDSFTLASGAAYLNPAIAFNPVDGEYLAVWDDGDSLSGRTVTADTSSMGDPQIFADKVYRQERGVVAFSTDGYLIAWQDHDDDGGYAEIRAQHLNQSAQPLGLEIGVSVAYYTQEASSVAFGSYHDQWLVVWADKRNFANSFDIYGQFVNRDGSLAGNPVAICYCSQDQRYPDVAYNFVDDEFLVVWEDQRDTNREIYGQRIDATNHATLGEIRVTNHAAEQHSPAVASGGPDGQYLVVWNDTRNDTGDIYGRRIEADGTFTDAFVLDISTRSETQAMPDVAYNPITDQYLVVWVDDALGVDGQGIAGQRVSTGSPWRLGQNFDIADPQNILYPEFLDNPAVASNTTTGDYLVVWDGGPFVVGGTKDIYGRLVGKTGGMPEDSFFISNADGDKTHPSVSYAPVTQRYFVAWDDDRGQSGDWNIFGQSLSSTGDLLFTNADTNLPSWVYSGDQYCPATAIDPQDDLLLLVWEDGRNPDNFDIYGRLGEPADSFNLYLPILLSE